MSPSIHHRRFGVGAPLVLLHGVGHHWQGWTPVLPLLAGSFDVLACDSPGFGLSPPLAPGVAATIPNYASAFQAWFAELGLERPHVAGNSMGGAIAIELARRGAVRSATAFSPAGFWSVSERRYCQLSLGAVRRVPAPGRVLIRAAARTATGRRALFPQLVARPGLLTPALAVGSLDALWAAPAAQAALDAFTQYRCAPLPAAAPPVRVVWGRHDRLLRFRTQSERARRLLPSAEHTVIDAGHVPFSDAPSAVADAIGATAGHAGPGGGAAPRRAYPGSRGDEASGGSLPR